MTLKPFLLCLSLSASWALAQPWPESCEELARAVRAEPYRQLLNDSVKHGPLYVVGSAVRVREGPAPTARVLQKLGYGVQVGIVSRACGEWVLVASPYWGYGFVHASFLRAEPYDEATLSAKQAQAPSAQERALWALARAHFFPSDSNTQEALALQAKAREALSPQDRGRCESHVGVCEVLLEKGLYEQKRLGSDPKVGEVPVGPWWMLTTATSAAQVAVFRAAYVDPMGECECGGCEPCQTTLKIAFEPLGAREQPPRGARERTPYLAASRRPPPSWFRTLSTEGCEKAEQTARQSPRWDVPLFQGDAKKPATPFTGTCIPGDDGSVWWQQEWLHPELDENESFPIPRAYRIVKGRVVERTTHPLVAWRDLDGDGRPDAIVPCPYGTYCTQARGFTR